MADVSMRVCERERDRDREKEEGERDGPRRTKIEKESYLWSCFVFLV